MRPRKRCTAVYLRRGAGRRYRGRLILAGVIMSCLLLTTRVIADPQAPTVFYPARYYPNSPDSAGAAPISLRPGERSSAITLMPLHSGGTLIVRVLDTEGSTIGGILVEAVSGRFQAVARTGNDGRAAVTGIPAGHAILRTRPDDPRSQTGAYAVRYAPGVLEPSQAERFLVTDAGDVDAGDLIVPPAGRIKAAVLRPNRERWFDVPVVVRAVDGTVRYVRRTDTEGRVTFGGLEPGSYRLWVDALGTEAVSECSDGTRDTLVSTPIDLARGSLVSGIVIETDRGAEVRGAVRDLSSNDGLPRIEVRFLPVTSPGTLYPFMTDSIGFYLARGLPSGVYRIYVPAIRRWYPSSQTEDGARSVSVVAGGETDGIDIRGELEDPCRLAPQSQGVIEGGVVADFTQLARAQIVAWNASDTARVTVTETSIFRIGCLAAGEYFVAIVPDGVYRTQYHPLTNDPAGARVVRVTQGDTTRSVNFYPELGVVVEGDVVSDAGGGGLADFPVIATNRPVGVRSEVLTDKDGRFRIDRLPDGTGLPAGDWFVATDSIAISTMTVTPVLAVGLEVARSSDGATLHFLVPDGLPVQAWSVERRGGGGDPVVVVDAGSHPEGLVARTCVDPFACDGCAYRLTVTVEGLGEAVELRSDWIAVGPPAAPPPHVFPHPWSGRGWLRLPRSVGPHQGVDLYRVDGTRLARLLVDGNQIAFEEGRLPPPGIYFLRYRDQDGRDRSERLVLRR